MSRGRGVDGAEAAHSWTPAPLAQLRTRRYRRMAALVAAGLLGLGLAWTHWLGLVLGGALVGLVSATLSRAVIAGFGLGVLVLLLNVLASPVMDPAEFLALAPASALTVVVGLVAPAWGSLVRAVV